MGLTAYVIPVQAGIQAAKLDARESECDKL